MEDVLKKSTVRYPTVTTQLNFHHIAGFCPFVVVGSFLVPWSLVSPECPPDVSLLVVFILVSDKFLFGICFATICIILMANHSVYDSISSFSPILSSALPISSLDWSHFAFFKWKMVSWCPCASWAWCQFGPLLSGGRCICRPVSPRGFPWGLPSPAIFPLPCHFSLGLDAPV